MPRHLTAIRLLTLWWLLGLCACASSGAVAGWTPALHCEPAEVYLRPAFPTYQWPAMSVIPFTSPEYAPNAGVVVAQAYYQELLRSGVFSHLQWLPQAPQAAADAGLQGVTDGGELVLRGQVLYLLAGSGTAPSRLRVETQVIDVTRHTVLWLVRQEAASEPGEETNLIWTTLPGRSAQPYSALAEALARQWAAVIAPPAEQLPPGSPGNPPLPAPTGTPASF
jgi:hypothetical protein